MHQCCLPHPGLGKGSVRVGRNSFRVRAVTHFADDAHSSRCPASFGTARARHRLHHRTSQHWWCRRKPATRTFGGIRSDGETLRGRHTEGRSTTDFPGKDSHTKTGAPQNPSSGHRSRKTMVSMPDLAAAIVTLGVLGVVAAATMLYLNRIHTDDGDSAD